MTTIGELEESIIKSSRYKKDIEGTSIIIKSIVEFIVRLESLLADYILTLYREKIFDY